MSNYIGIDDGHYSIKICTETGQTFSIPSRVVKRAEYCYNSEDKQNSIQYINSNDDIYTVIPENQKGISDIIDTRTGDFYASEANQVLVMHLLNQSGFSDKAINIVSGLPFEFYYKNSVKNNKIVQKKIDNLLNVNINCVNNNIINPKVINHSVVSEAVATLYDMMYDFNLKPQKNMIDLIDNAPIAIIDIGGRTIDIASIKEGGENLYHNFSGSEQFGALSLIDDVIRLIKNECEVDISSYIQLAEKTIETGLFYKAGKKIDLSEKIELLKKKFADKIINSTIPKILGNHANNVQMVLFTGGGAMLINKYIYNYAHNNVVLADSPQFSNARGMAKVALMLGRQQND